MGEIFNLIRVPAAAFLGSFLVVGGWLWGPQILRYIPGFSSGNSSISSAAPSAGSGGSWLADLNRLGRPEIAPVLQSCIFRVVDAGAGAKIEPGAAYLMLRGDAITATMTAAVGRIPVRSEEDPAVALAEKWGKLANCIFGQEDRELCDPDNRAAMVEATARYFT